VGEHAYQLVFDGVHVRPLHGEEAEPGNEFEVWSRIDVREEAGGTCSVQFAGQVVIEIEGLTEPEMKELEDQLLVEAQEEHLVWLSKWMALAQSTA